MRINDGRDVPGIVARLIEICNLGELGFRTAATGVSEPTLRRLLESYARQRAEFVVQLEAEVPQFGARVDPPRDHIGDGDIAEGLNPCREADTDEPAILAGCARGERSAERAFRKAAEKRIPGALGRIVERQHLQVKDAHDHVRSLQASQLAGHC